MADQISKMAATIIGSKMAARRRLEKSMYILINGILSYYGFSCMQNQTLVLFLSFILLEFSKMQDGHQTPP